jgi:hypothetical protein
MKIQIWGTSTGFWKTQMRVVSLLLFMGTIGAMVGWRELQSEMISQDYSVEENEAEEILAELDNLFKKAQKGSIIVDGGPDRLPNSHLQFKSGDGRLVSCFTRNGTAIFQIDNKPQRTVGDVSALYFIPQEKGNYSKFEIELHVLKNRIVSENVSEMKPIILTRKIHSA